MNETISKNDLEEINERANRALRHVAEIAQGRARWTMHIPARPGIDSDLLFAEVARDAKRLAQALSDRTVASETSLKDALLACCRPTTLP